MEGDQHYSSGVPPVPSSSPSLPMSDLPLPERSRREKLTITAVVVVALVAVGMLFFQTSRTAHGPVTALLTGTDSDTITGDAQNIQQDTDHDGLSDYLELTSYQTSPYLEDSDGDGVDDKTEVDAGQNPNCAGASCTGAAAEGDTTVPQFQTGVSTGSLQAPTVAQLRQSMLAAGMSQADVDGLSDAEILALYQEVTSGTTATSSAGASRPVSSSTGNLSAYGVNSVSDLSKLTGAQIRQLMLAQGAPAGVLDQVSDEDLEQMFRSQLQSKVNSNSATQ